MSKALPPDLADDDTPPDARMPTEPIELRPDGYYWVAADGKRAFGPFHSYADALADLHAGDPDDLEPGETLQEAESEIGITTWIDPETGEPAEGLAPPHLEHD